jgi:pectate lyase
MARSNLTPRTAFNMSVFVARAAWMLLALVSQLLQASLSSSASSNPIDNCWRRDVNWAQNRMKLADCAVGFGSAASGGKGGQIYTVTTPDDNPTNPLPGSLRYGVTRKSPLWIVFAKDMNIKLQMPLSVTSYKTIDGRGAKVQISNGPCIRLANVSNVIIHGLNIHDCKPSVAGNVRVTESVSSSSTGLLWMETQDADAISVLGCRDIWIDHNTLSKCLDGLVDVTLSSTAVTISNNRFSYHDKAS